MELLFAALAEDHPGAKWRAQFKRLWPAYRDWYLSDGIESRPTYAQCRSRLADAMPELLGTYERLCELAGGGDLPARFLSLYRPPHYISGCSQVAWPDREPALIRNYDYAPTLCDGIILKTRWNGRRVIAMTDCMWGCLDGLNDAGLAVSLTFGGRRAYGEGFGAPLLLRYLLEVCSTAAEAGTALKGLPSHMAYNITVLDRGGDFRTGFLAPDRPAKVRQVAIATNHQGRVEWHNHARATATLERERFLGFRLADPEMTPERLSDAFLRPPLYTNAYESGFGTIYTAVYRPARGEVEYRWPDVSWRLGFDDFAEGRRHVRFTRHWVEPAGLLS